ncbi:acylpyruvase FAHD1 [Physcia stellaris]|nr:acylpyruvase FAHD1 [Physcia stellaris]
MQQLSQATARNTEAIARTGILEEQFSGATARIELLEEQIRDQSVSHSEVHDRTKVIREDLHRLSDAVDPRDSVINAASAMPTHAAGQHNTLGHSSMPSDGLGTSQSSDGNSRAGPHDQSYGAVPSPMQMDETQPALPRNESSAIRRRSDRARAYAPDLRRRDDCEPQGFLELAEYMIMRGDTIEAILRDVEKKLVNDFINDMDDADQRSMLVERLNHTAWTLKTAKQQVTAICQAEFEPQGVGGLARRWAAEAAGMAEAEGEGEEESEREAQRSAPKSRVQRKTRRRRKNW